MILLLNNVQLNKLLLQNKQMEPVYPTSWFGGKLGGSIAKLKFGYRVTMSPPKQESYAITFFYKDFYDDDAYTHQKAKEYMRNESDKLNLTRNHVRWIDNKTIEVKLTMDQIMITDGEFLKKVEKYPLEAQNNGKKFYVICNNAKDQFQFTTFIENAMAKYINGNTLDLRRTNITFSKSLPDKREYLLNKIRNIAINNNLNRPIKINNDMGF